MLGKPYVIKIGRDAKGTPLAVSVNGINLGELAINQTQIFSARGDDEQAQIAYVMSVYGGDDFQQLLPTGDLASVVTEYAPKNADEFKIESCAKSNALVTLAEYVVKGDQPVETRMVGCLTFK